MKLTDMKRSKKERKENGIGACKPYEGDTYGYGLRVRLDKADMEKLGIDAGTHKVGGNVTIHAVAKVTSVSQNQSEGSDGHASVEFQITQMGVEKGGARTMADAISQGLKK